MPGYRLKKLRLANSILIKDNLLLGSETLLVVPETSTVSDLSSSLEAVYMLAKVSLNR